MSVLSLLVTGPEEQLQEFHLQVCMRLNGINRRKQTIHYTCLSEDYAFAVRAAKGSDVTLQLIMDIRPKPGAELQYDACGSGLKVPLPDNGERYKLVHLGSHKMKWAHTAE